MTRKPKLVAVRSPMQGSQPRYVLCGRCGEPLFRMLTNPLRCDMAGWKKDEGEVWRETSRARRRKAYGVPPTNRRPTKFAREGEVVERPLRESDIASREHLSASMPPLPFRAHCTHCNSVNIINESSLGIGYYG